MPLYAPVDAPPPALRVPAPALAASLRCGADVDDASRTPVLLVHGTNVTPEANWSHTYEPGLRAHGVPTCTVRIPNRATGDIQVNAEYVVHAIRETHRRAGRRISIVGASQGGMIPRWALRFWRDLRPMVDDLVGLVPSNHGSTSLDRCDPGCSPAIHQQSAGSAFLDALNSHQETFPGISYTNVYTRTDETVQPNQDDTGSSSLHGGGGRITNVAIQDVCALSTSEHILTGSADPIAFALTVDALAHDGPAVPGRAAPVGCLTGPIPGADPVGLLARVPDLLSGADSVEPTDQEPPLACYVTASCLPAVAPAPAVAPSGGVLRVRVSPRRPVAGRTVRLRLRVHRREDARWVPVRGATLRIAGRRARSDRRGRIAVRVRFARPGLRGLRVRAAGSPARTVRVRVVRPRPRG